MKKLFAIAALGLFSFSAAHAQQNDKMLFNHLSVGITTGTPGLIGFDVATTCTPYLQIRAGISIMPNIKYSTNIKLAESDVQSFNNKRNDINTVMATLGLPTVNSEVQKEYGVEGKLGWTNGKILFDFFPFTSNGFPLFITVGAYFGGSQIISVYNQVPGSLDIVNQANRSVDAYNKWIDNNPAAASAAGFTKTNDIYAKVGIYDKLGPNPQGDVKFDVKVNGFKPYLGIGFGRPVPKTKRVGFQVELGCIFWKTPSVTFSGNREIAIEKDGVKDDKDVGKAFDVISKFGVWPCLNFRICGKIF